MKTICFVVSTFPTVSETFVVNQIIAAKQQGFQVLVLTSKKLSANETSQYQLLKKYEIMKHVVVVDYNIPKRKFVRRIKALCFISFHFRNWICLAKDYSFRKRFSTLPFKMKFYKQFNKVDVFHIQFAIAGTELASMKYCNLLKGKVITTFHGFDSHFENGAQLVVLQKRYKVLIKVSDFVTVNTQYLANKVKQLGVFDSQLSIVPMGVDTAFFSSKVAKVIDKEQDIKLLSIGRLIDLKGFAYAVKAVKQLVDLGFNVNYTIVGEGIERNNLEHLINTLELSNHVFLLGKQNQDCIKELMEKHHLFVMSSITDDTGRAEAQGVVTAEAQAMGLPVVAFKSGGVPYTIKDGETGILLPEKSIEALSGALIALMESPNVYKKMSKEASKFANDEFSLEVMGKRFLNLYKT